MQLAIKIAEESLDTPDLTPFGAVIVYDRNPIAIGRSQVIQDCSAISHAETNAISSASKKLGHHLLHGAELYCSGFPCPMCLSAALNAEVKAIYYAATLDDSSQYGFRDKEFYYQLAGTSHIPVRATDMPIQPSSIDLRVKSADILRRWHFIHHPEEKE